MMRAKDSVLIEVCSMCLKHLTDNSYLEKVMLTNNLISINTNNHFNTNNLLKKYTRVYSDHLLHLVMFVYYNHL